MLAVALTLHDLEEVVAHSSRLNPADGLPIRTVSSEQFRFAVVVLTVLVWVVVAWAVRSRRPLLALHVMAGMAGVLALNVLFPHVTISVRTWAYSPGLLTAVLLNAPVCWLVLRDALRRAGVDVRSVSLSVAISAAATVALVALLFATAEMLS